MRVSFLSVFALIFAETSGTAYESVTQVQLDVVVLSGPAAILESPAMKALHLKKEGNGSAIGTFESDAVSAFVRECCENQGAKLLAEPKIVTQDSRPARFLSGGQIPVPGEVDGRPSVTFQNFGTELNLLPTIRKDGLIYLEISPVIRAVNRKRGTQPDRSVIFDEQSTRFAAAVKQGQTILACMPDGKKVTIFAVTPTLVRSPAPAQPLEPARVATVVAKLMLKYRDALAKGDKELAREFAQMALDLDPGCFAASSEPATSAARR